MNSRPTEDQLSHLPTLAFLLLLNRKNTEEASTTTSCFYPCQEKCNQQTNNQTKTNKQREGG